MTKTPMFSRTGPTICMARPTGNTARPPQSWVKHAELTGTSSLRWATYHLVDGIGLWGTCAVVGRRINPFYGESVWTSDAVYAVRRVVLRGTPWWQTQSRGFRRGVGIPNTTLVQKSAVSAARSRPPKHAEYPGRPPRATFARYDRLTDPECHEQGLKYGDWYYGPQKRLMASFITWDALDLSSDLMGSACDGVPPECGGKPHDSKVWQSLQSASDAWRRSW